ncbi:hypothetical protein ACI8AF_20320 [Blastococcus sp. SYSU D00669]
MRITFERMADRRPVETLVERDDGVTFLMRGAGGGAALPHDLVHALVERELGVPDGIWGCVADGVVWGSMRHVSGRQPPHGAERSARLKKEREARITAAEGLADVVARLARDQELLPAQLAQTGYDRAALDRAAAALRTAASEWSARAPGDRLTVEWAATRPQGRRRR